MDPKKSQSGSSSSLTSQLFRSQDSSSPTDVLSSIFPPSKGTGRNPAYNDGRGSWQKEPSGNQPWNYNQDNSYIHGDAAKNHSSIYQQEGTAPCHLSSSLYYGGRETYSKSHPTNQSSTSYPAYKKDSGEDDPSGASRGNWWQGSLYY